MLTLYLQVIEHKPLDSVIYNNLDNSKFQFRKKEADGEFNTFSYHCIQFFWWAKDLNKRINQKQKEKRLRVNFLVVENNHRNHFSVLQVPKIPYSVEFSTFWNWNKIPHLIPFFLNHDPSVFQQP